MNSQNVKKIYHSKFKTFDMNRNCSLGEKWIENCVVTSDVFKKGRQKLSLLNLSKRDNIVSLTFF